MSVLFCGFFFCAHFWQQLILNVLNEILGDDIPSDPKIILLSYVRRIAEETYHGVLNLLFATKMSSTVNWKKTDPLFKNG